MVEEDDRVFAYPGITLKIDEPKIIAKRTGKRRTKPFAAVPAITFKPKNAAVYIRHVQSLLKKEISLKQD